MERPPASPLYNQSIVKRVKTDAQNTLAALRSYSTAHAAWGRQHARLPHCRPRHFSLPRRLDLRKLWCVRNLVSFNESVSLRDRGLNRKICVCNAGGFSIKVATDTVLTRTNYCMPRPLAQTRPRSTGTQCTTPWSRTSGRRSLAAWLESAPVCGCMLSSWLYSVPTSTNEGNALPTENFTLN